MWKPGSLVAGGQMGDEVQEMEPLLRPGFRCGIHVETDMHVRPASVTAGLAAS